jgi:glucokinase
MFLAGDVGGTKTRLALFAADGPRLRPVAQATFRSRDYPGPAPIIGEFLKAHPQAADRVCLGVAGPVRQGRVVTPNLPWEVHGDRLRDELRSGPVDLINDLEANAYGLQELGPGDFAVLNEGSPTAAGNAALISAGTGLGEAGLFWDGSRHRPFASEGGHADFGPRGPLQAELANHLAGKHAHVSYERILSGPGLEQVYRFLQERSGRPDELPRLMEEFGVADAPAAISKAAFARRSEVCGRALDLFAEVYGAEAGNLALKVLATGGVFLGGGIAPKVLPKLREPAFREAFIAKGRMRSLMETIPVRVILNDRAALLGAARYAAARMAP